MIHEFRQYRLKVGRLPEYVAAFEQIALPVINKHMNILGFWTSDTGELNKVFHLWAFENAEQRILRYAALRADPEYKDKFLPIALPLIEHMQSTLLTPMEMTPALPLFANRPRWSSPAG
jgi:NIPSNAP